MSETERTICLYCPHDRSEHLTSCPQSCEAEGCKADAHCFEPLYAWAHPQHSNNMAHQARYHSFDAHVACSCGWSHGVNDKAEGMHLIDIHLSNSPLRETDKVTTVDRCYCGEPMDSGMTCCLAPNQ